MPERTKSIVRRTADIVARQFRRPLSSRVNWVRRERIIERYMQGVARELTAKGEISSAHSPGHWQRANHYAGKYVEFMGGNPAMQSQARIAGWTHDRIRYPTEERKHEPVSGEFMGKLFQRRYGVKPTAQMTEAISRHGELPNLTELGRNTIHEGLVYADKFFEANGAYIAFRRAMFMGKKKDRRTEAQEKGYDLNTVKGRREAAIDFVLNETEKRLSAYSDKSKVPELLHGFLDYQVEWQKRLQNGLQRRQKWAVNLVEKVFAEGLRESPSLLDDIIRNYEPVARIDAEFQREALRYLDGGLWKEFKKRVKKPKLS